MLFNSSEFAIFFIIIFGLYFLLRNNFKIQNKLLLIASYVFYGWWDIRFLFLIVLSTAIDFISGLMIDRGIVTIKQRIKTSLYVFISVIIFLFFQYKELINTFRKSEKLLWKNLIHPSGYYIILIAIVAIIVFNIIYFLTKNLSEKKKRIFYLVLSIATNLSILGFFKYFNFFMDSFSNLCTYFFNVTPNNWTLKIILPVGISFYTFQTMSYSIDIYRKKLKSTDYLIEFAAYVAFFPQLVAGPIERAKHLLPQFFKKRDIAKGKILHDSLWLIFWGLYKKIVIADNMSIIVNKIFGPFDTLNSIIIPEDGLRLLIGLYAFAFQIYGDFSGYTDIARGIAKLLGFDLRRNFNLPYFATSPSDFWKRWHISLSSWLGDYLYIPLGGNRKGKISTYINLSLTMLLGGLWHGASWTFIIWGAYQGFLLIIYRIMGIQKKKNHYSLGKKMFLIFIMFQFTCLGWLIFRAQNITTISIFLKSIFLKPFWSNEAWIHLRTMFGYIWFLIIFQTIQVWKKNLEPVKNFHWFIKLNIWLFIILSLLTMANPEVKEFIYFAF